METGMGGVTTSTAGSDAFFLQHLGRFNDEIQVTRALTGVLEAVTMLTPEQVDRVIARLTELMTADLGARSDQSDDAG